MAINQTLAHMVIIIWNFTKIANSNWSIPWTASSRHNIPQIADSIPYTASVSIIDLTTEIEKKIKQHDRESVTWITKKLFIRNRVTEVSWIFKHTSYSPNCWSPAFWDTTFLFYLQWFNSEKHTADNIHNKIHYNIDTFVDFFGVPHTEWNNYI